MDADISLTCRAEQSIKHRDVLALQPKVSA
jgi:hypothetical protein